MADAPAVDVTGLLQSWRRGDAGAGDRLVPVVYAELRRLARARLRGEHAETVQVTSLVQEAYLRLVDQRGVDWRDRSHFFGLASTMMRRILIDHARARTRLKRAHHAVPITIATDVPGEQRSLVEIIDLDRLLTRLAADHPRPAKIIELRFFGGLELDEIAVVLEVSDRTVKRDWAFARAWLLHHLEQGAA